MHESAVRVILRDESGRLEYLCSLQGNSLDEAIEELEEPQSALRYYDGFTLIISNQTYSYSSGSSAMASIPENNDRSDRSLSSAEAQLLDSSVGDNSFVRLEGEESNNL
jgi:hypothetical protein